MYLGTVNKRPISLDAFAVYCTSPGGEDLPGVAARLGWTLVRAHDAVRELFLARLILAVFRAGDVRPVYWILAREA